MKKIFFLTLLTALSCGKNNSIKRTPTPYQVPKVDTIIKQEELSVERLFATQVELSGIKLGKIDSSQIEKKNERFLRDKLVRFAAFEIVGEKLKEDLELSYRDEMSFYPGELTSLSKNRLNEMVEEGEEEAISWGLKGAIRLEGISQAHPIKNVVLGLSSYNNFSGKLSHYGQDLLRDLDGQALVFEKTRAEKEFQISYRELSTKILKNLSKANERIVLELLDLEVSEKNLTQFIEKKRKGTIRVYVSTPDKDQFFDFKKGTKITEIISKLDPNYRLNYRGELKEFRGFTASSFRTRPDRNLLNSRGEERQRKLWWANFDSLEQAAEDSLALVYTSLKELRKNRESWKPLEFSFEGRKEIREENALAYKGIFKKVTTNFSHKTFTKTLHTQFALKECMEDHRFERKGVDCYLRWYDSKNRPTAKFRRQVSSAKGVSLVEAEELEVHLGDKKVDLKNHELKVESAQKFRLESKLKPLGKTAGGFIGWSSFPASLNGHKLRYPNDNLGRSHILSGDKNVFIFKGWKKEFIPFD